MFLTNQLTEDDNKALGLGYTVQDDKLHIMIAVNFSKKRRKMRLGQDLLKGQVRSTRREILSQVSALYDLLGLVTPAKQKGAILVQRAFQEAKGDALKVEVCGAVFAARLKKYFQRHCRVPVEKWYHLVDSQTILVQRCILSAVQHERYGYQTFFANRIGEIQSSTNVQDWWWVPGQVNIADIIVRGAGPKDLDEDSEWQSGPKFLSLPVNEWPIKSAKDVAAAARENITKVQKKAFFEKKSCSKSR
ncbi:uncharacterized protein LOC122145514 [Tachysurus ichikawai]